jgi:FixJ family two-component response regulator
MSLISIVDDDLSVREALGGLMKVVGYDSDAFESAEAFLSSDRVLATACVIADVQMPGMSGLELQARLIRDGHRIPFIFITAFPNEQARGRALDGGAISFLSKPFGETELLEGIGLALESSNR